MPGIVLMILRYIFLLLLLLFIFMLVKWMVGDLRNYSLERRELCPAAGEAENKNPASKVPGVSLTVLESSQPDLQPGDSFGVGQEITIGRGGENDIITGDSFASTRHARIYLNEEQYWLEDLNSTNGTFLNGVLILKPTVLADADRVRIGGITFEFVRWGYEVGSNI